MKKLLIAALLAVSSVSLTAYTPSNPKGQSAGEEHIDAHNTIQNLNLTDGTHKVSTSRQGYILEATVRDGEIVEYRVQNRKGDPIQYDLKTEGSGSTAKNWLVIDSPEGKVYWEL